MTYNLEELEQNMLRIRLVEESIAEKYSEQKMRCPTHLSIGQEAVSVGVCGNLSKEDFLMSTHRAHAHYLAKGGNLKAMIAEIYGKKTGCSGGMGGSMHLLDEKAGLWLAGPEHVPGDLIMSKHIFLSLKRRFFVTQKTFF